jgi:hypothetical protein
MNWWDHRIPHQNSTNGPGFVTGIGHSSDIELQPFSEGKLPLSVWLANSSQIQRKNEKKTLMTTLFGLAIVPIDECDGTVAVLVQAGHVAHFLPAYSHLLLATTVVAASWVGWSVSLAPGARQDVCGVFQSVLSYF